MSKVPTTSAQAVRVDGPPGSSAVAHCYRHAGERADTSCFVCMKPVCAVCTQQSLEGAVCPPCATDIRTREKRTRTLRAVASVVGVAALAIGVTVVRRMPDYQGKGAQVDALQEQLQKEPCDRAAAVKLADLLVGLHLYPRALDVTQGYFARCPPYPRLLWAQYSAHKFSHDYDAALQDATALIDGEPDDKDYRWWRGMVHELRGRMDLAAVDYRQAWALVPRLENIPFNLAAAYEASGQPCEAALPLQAFLAYHPSTSNAAEISSRIKRVLRSEGCQDLQVVDLTRARNPAVLMKITGSSGAIAPDKRTGELAAKVTVDGKGPLTLGMDEGSPYVLLTPAAAHRLELTVPSEKIRVATAAGVVQAALVTLPDITVGGIKVPKVKAAVLDEPACKEVVGCDGRDGWLGASLLSRVGLQGRDDGSLVLAAPSVLE